MEEFKELVKQIYLEMAEDSVDALIDHYDFKGMDFDSNGEYEYEEITLLAGDIAAKLFGK